MNGNQSRTSTFWKALVQADECLFWKSFNPDFEYFFQSDQLLLLTFYHTMQGKKKLFEKKTVGNDDSMHYLHSVERGMNPVAMTIISSQKEYWLSWQSEPATLCSQFLNTTD